MTKQDLFSIKLPEYRADIRAQAKRVWDSLAKPIDGLGDFEALICDVAAIQGKLYPDISNRALIVFCADNGIVSEGVSQSSQEVTASVATNLGKNVSSASWLAKSVEARVIPVDVGINSDTAMEGVLDRKVAKGTADFLEGPAMTEEEVLAAIETGISIVYELAGDKNAVNCQKLQDDNQAMLEDYQGMQENLSKRIGLLATGEMGIGNTTTSTAVLCSLLGLDSTSVTGRGAGLDDKGLDRKREVIRAGIEKYKAYFDEIREIADKAFEILRCLGGLDIAAMSGVFIGGALCGVPIVIDGVISAVAALLAERMVAGCSKYMLASHAGRESGTLLALNALGKKPYINGNMALGEGTAALMMIPLIDSVLYFYKEGIRFDDCGIEKYERFN